VRFATQPQGARAVGNQNLDVERHIWDRQDGESSKAFGAFTIYRDAGAERKLQQVAEVLRCSGANVRRWATRWCWARRAAEWDIAQDHLKQKALQRERTKMIERQAKLGMEMQDIGASALYDLKRRMQSSKPTRVRPTEIAKLIEAGAQLERRARGEEKESERPPAEFNITLVPIDDEGNPLA
jgi:hypothetical protein